MIMTAWFDCCIFFCTPLFTNIFVPPIFLFLQILYLFIEIYQDLVEMSANVWTCIVLFLQFEIVLINHIIISKDYFGTRIVWTIYLQKLLSYATGQGYFCAFANKNKNSEEIGIPEGDNDWSEVFPLPID